MTVRCEGKGRLTAPGRAYLARRPADAKERPGSTELFMSVKKPRKSRAKRKKLVWVPAARVETRQAAEALDEFRMVRFPSPTGKVGRPAARSSVLGVI